MIKAVIIDDELKSREVLETLLNQMVEGVMVIGTADSVITGVRLLERSEPDVVFLDIEMPRKDGFQLLDELRPFRFEVVFTTGHDQYAIQAFRNNAIDYLMKPIDIDQLQHAVDKVREKKHLNQLNSNYEAFVADVHKSDEHKRQIALPGSGGTTFVKIEDIVYLRGDGAYTYFFLKNGKRVTVSKNLKEYERQLESDEFFRVHKSFLIHLPEMVRYVRGDGSYVLMSNGDKVDVSKRRREGFMAALSKL
ncbi:MAG: response regulator transcription factor [Flavobacteriales bacterium]|nr:response regulator transcription factor [Flavobacteriales bacterium]